MKTSDLQSSLECKYVPVDDAFEIRFVCPELGLDVQESVPAAGFQEFAHSCLTSAELKILGDSTTAAIASEFATAWRSYQHWLARN